ncbi:MAG TPA: hypothetical protein VFO76_07780 [Candidatus Kapabacteria bacterium]|nr:hypothetical protein [Candidatus Kapabacteria bacterium]
MKYSQLIRLGAIVALVGYICSGPVGFLVTILVHPQPSWRSASLFASQYDIIQDIPYYFGLLLISGMLMLAAGHYRIARSVSDETSFHLLLSLMWSVVFAALVSFNYLCQTTFIRHLALNYHSENDSLIAAFSLSNPMSLSWAIEMWGYGILGVANLLLSGYYRQKNTLIRSLLIANGIISIATVIVTIIDIHWVMTTPGLIGYFLWNILMIWMMIAMIRYWNIKTTSPAV